VNLKVHHLDQRTSIYLQFNRLSQHRISGFPQSMTQLTKLQLLQSRAQSVSGSAVSFILAARST
jgi:hypothetical protein